MPKRGRKQAMKRDLTSIKTPHLTIRSRASGGVRLRAMRGARPASEIPEAVHRAPGSFQTGTKTPKRLGLRESPDQERKTDERKERVEAGTRSRFFVWRDRYFPCPPVPVSIRTSVVDCARGRAPPLRDARFKPEPH